MRHGDKKKKKKKTALADCIMVYNIMCVRRASLKRFTAGRAQRVVAAYIRVCVVCACAKTNKVILIDARARLMQIVQRLYRVCLRTI